MPSGDDSRLTGPPTRHQSEQHEQGEGVGGEAGRHQSHGHQSSSNHDGDPRGQEVVDYPRYRACGQEFVDYTRYGACGQEILIIPATGACGQKGLWVSTQRRRGGGE